MKPSVNNHFRHFHPLAPQRGVSDPNVCVNMYCHAQGSCDLFIVPKHDGKRDENLGCSDFDSTPGERTMTFIIDHQLTITDLDPATKQNLNAG